MSVAICDILYLSVQKSEIAKSYILFDGKWRFVCMIYCASGWHMKYCEYPSSYSEFLKDEKVERIKIIVE